MACNGNRGRVYCAVLALWMAAAALSSSLRADTSAEWRFWDSDDGLADRYVESIRRDGSGAVFAAHGDVSDISRLDGLSFARVPTPFAFNKRPFDSVDGKSGWVAEEDGLRYLHDGKWETFPQIKPLAPMADSHNGDARALDLGGSRALLLISNRLTRFSALSHRMEDLPFPPADSRIGRLFTLERGTDDSIWIVGDRGVAHLARQPGASVPYSWQEYPFGNLKVERPAFPVPCLHEEFFLTAFRKGSSDRAILRLWEGKWEVLGDVPQPALVSFAWRDGAGDLWLADGPLYRKSAKDPQRGWVEIESQHSDLGGRVHGVVVNTDGSFFISSPFGVALHINVAWRAFEQATGSRGNRIQLKQHMTAMLEDRRQRLWILGAHSMFRYYKDHWEEYPIPREYVADLSQRNSLGELADGRILIQLQEAPYLITFDPETLRIEPVKPVAGYKPITFCKRRDGQFLVAMIGTEGDSDGLAILDDSVSLSSVQPIHARWNVRYPRGMVETVDGEVWVGGTSGLAHVAEGRFERFDSIDVPRSESAGTGAKIKLQVFSMLADGDRGVLVGGKQLLCRWNGKNLEWLTAFPLAIQLMRDRFGILWAGTPSDVRRTSKPENLRLGSNTVWIPNDVNDGLPMSVGNSVLEDSRDRVWAISGKGAAIFQRNGDCEPPIATIRADQNSGEAAPSGEFHVIFTGKDKWDLTPIGALQYSHRLDRNAWSPFSTATTLSFHRLAIGKHVFEVVAMDRQGNVSARPARLAFAAAAPWYRTSGFLSIMTAGLIVIAGLLWFSIRQVMALQGMATQDSLTGSWNRRAIFKRLSDELARGKRDLSPVAVIMADLDGFKGINDTYGHPAGDLVLRAVADQLRASLRRSDLVGRYGGEEFLMVLPDCDRSGAASRAEDVRRAVAMLTVPLATGDLRVTCSFGVGWTRNGSYKMEELLRDADLALYRAKAGGRNRVESTGEELVADDAAVAPSLAEPASSVSR